MDKGGQRCSDFSLPEDWKIQYNYRWMTLSINDKSLENTIIRFICIKECELQHKKSMQNYCTNKKAKLYMLIFPLWVRIFRKRPLDKANISLCKRDKFQLNTKLKMKDATISYQTISWNELLVLRLESRLAGEY